MTVQSAPRLWVPEEAAKYLGIPLKTLYRWRTEGKGPEAMKIGKHLRYEPSDVISWAQEQADSRRSATA